MHEYMKWKEIKEGHTFIDGSQVTQRHQTHLYDCYEIEYDGKKIVLSKDHLLKVNIEKLPIGAQNEIKEWCNGEIPLTEDLEIQFLSKATDEEKDLIQRWIIGEPIDLDVEDLSEDDLEVYSFNFENKPFGVEVFVKRNTTSWDNQKIDDNNYWVPVEGLAYLFEKYGGLEI